MALIKESFIDLREILALGQIQIRYITKVWEDDVLVADGFKRDTIVPGQDISHMDAETQAIANALWTPEKIAEYQASQPNFGE